MSILKGLGSVMGGARNSAATTTAKKVVKRAGRKSLPKRTFSTQAPAKRTFPSATRTARPTRPSVAQPLPARVLQKPVPTKRAANPSVLPARSFPTAGRQSRWHEMKNSRAAQGVNNYFGDPTKGRRRKMVAGGAAVTAAAISSSNNKTGAGSPSQPYGTGIYGY